MNTSSRSDRILQLLVRRLGVPGAIALLQEVHEVPRSDGATQPRFPHPATARARLVRSELRRLVRAGMSSAQIVRTVRHFGYSRDYVLWMLRRLGLAELHPVRVRAWTTRRHHAAVREVLDSLEPADRAETQPQPEAEAN